MKIAVSYEDGNIFQHFGHSKMFKIYEIDGQNIVDTKIIEAQVQLQKRNKIYNLFLLHTMLTFQFWVMLKEFLWLSIKIQRLIYRKGILT